jgi:Acid Phosphatase
MSPALANSNKKSKSTKAKTETNSTPPTMRLAIFDLDYTIWRPEMYQLYGQPKLVPPPASMNTSRYTARQTKKHRAGGEAWTYTNRDGMVLMDSQGSVMELFPGA